MDKFNMAHRDAWIRFMAAAIADNAGNEGDQPEEVARVSAEIADAALGQCLKRFSMTARPGRDLG